jgi:hypothetical protein
LDEIIRHPFILDKGQDEPSDLGIILIIDIPKFHFFLTLLYDSLRVVIPVKGGIQVEKTGFPLIKYGAGLTSPE